MRAAQSGWRGLLGALASNETKLSHRWQRRAFVTSTAVSQNQMWASRRLAVGSSDWLDASGFILDARLQCERPRMCCSEPARMACAEPLRDRRRDRQENGAWPWLT